MSAKSTPLSVRISAGTEKLIEDEARRTNRSRGAVVGALAEEALHTRMFPGIAFRGEDWNRRPWVIGTAFDVWQVVDVHRDFGSVEAMVAEGSLSERAIGLALAYYERFPEEVDEAIDRNRTSPEQLMETYPFIPVAVAGE